MGPADPAQAGEGTMPMRFHIRWSLLLALTSDRFRNTPKALGIALALVPLVLYTAAFGDKFHNYRWPVVSPHGDIRAYFRMAFHLQRNRISSLSPYTSTAPAPTSLRLPGYPLVLAGVIQLDPHLRSVEPTRFLKGKSFRSFRAFLYPNFISLYLASIICGLVVYRLTSSLAAAYVCTLLVGFDRTLWLAARVPMPEHTVAFLIAAASAALYAWFSTRRLVWSVLAGLILCALALTRATFAYFPLLLLPILLVNAWRYRPKWRPDVTAVCLCVCLPMVAVQSWRARNFAHSGRWHLSLRGGRVLGVRAEYNMVNRRQYLAGVAHYSRSNTGAAILKRYFEEDDYACFDRDKGNPASIHRRANRRARDLIREHGPVAADEILLRDAMGKIKAHPIRHLLMCLPFAVRGMRVIMLWPMPAPRSFLLFAALFGVLAVAAFRRRWDSVALLLPAFYSFAFYTGLTHGLRRYSQPLLPMLYVAATVAGYHMACGLWRHGPWAREEAASGDVASAEEK